MNEKIEVPTMKVPPLKKICMTLGQLPASYVESMSYYEMLVWFVHYLRDDIIPVVNANGEATRELQELYVELQNYVNNYFDNLDVQEEINNKLDEMADSGQLTDIIAQYLGLAGMITFNNVGEMKLAENLVNGSKCATLGYYNVNDGGNAFYKVRTITNDDVVDEANIIELYDDSLIAELIKEDNINVKQYGAYGDGIHDDTSKIQLALNSYKNVFIPKGTYNITQITINQYQHLFGEGINSFIKSTSDNSTNQLIAIDIPASSDHVIVENIKVNGGIQNGVSGSASVQDISNTFKNITINNGYGFRVHHRGNYLNNIHVGDTYYGIHISGTDNFIDSCVTANTNKHGILIQGPNNSVANCKSFMAGASEWGVGIYTIGAFERITNCESQQNYYENYWFNNSLSTIVSGCISDGAFWTHESMETYTNPILSTTLNSSAIFLNNLQNGNIQIDNINGSLFGSSHASTKEVLGIKYANTIHKSIIMINSQNRNDYSNKMHDGIIYNLCSNNKIILNGIDYNSFNTKGSIINEMSATFSAVSQTQRMATLRLPTDTTLVSLNFGEVGSTTGVGSYWWDVTATLLTGDTPTTKNSSWQSIANTNPSFDVSNWLSQFTYDSVSAMVIRVIAVSDSDHSGFTFKVNDVSLWSTNATINNQ